MSEFKKSGKRRNVRKRKTSNSDSDESSASSVVRGEKRLAPANPMKTATCSIKKLKEVSKHFININQYTCHKII